MDVIKGLSASMSTLGGYRVLAFFASQYGFSLSQVFGFWVWAGLPRWVRVRR